MSNQTEFERSLGGEYNVAWQRSTKEWRTTGFRITLNEGQSSAYILAKWVMTRLEPVREDDLYDF